MIFTLYTTATQESVFLDGDCRKHKFGSLLFAYMDCDWGEYGSRFDELVTVGTYTPFAENYLYEAAKTYNGLYRELERKHPYLSLALKERMVTEMTATSPLAHLWNTKKYLWQYAERLLLGKMEEDACAVGAENLADFHRMIESCIQGARCFCNTQAQQHREVFDRYISDFLLSEAQGRSKILRKAGDFRKGGKYHQRLIQLLKKIETNFDVFALGNGSDGDMPTRYYQSACVESLVAIELVFFSEYEVSIRACANCGGLFIPRTKASLYCARVQANTGKACQQTAPKETYAAKMDEDHMRKAFVKNRSVYKMRIKRAPYSEKTKAEYDTWSEDISRIFKQVQCGECPEEDFWAAVEVPKRKYVKKSQEGE